MRWSSKYSYYVCPHSPVKSPCSITNKRFLNYITTCPVSAFVDSWWNVSTRWAPTSYNWGYKPLEMALYIGNWCYITLQVELWPYLQLERAHLHVQLAHAYLYSLLYRYCFKNVATRTEPHVNKSSKYEAYVKWWDDIFNDENIPWKRTAGISKNAKIPWKENHLPNLHFWLPCHVNFLP